MPQDYVFITETPLNWYPFFDIFSVERSYQFFASIGLPVMSVPEVKEIIEAARQISILLNEGIYKSYLTSEEYSVTFSNLRIAD